jgi:DNA-binding transcriptional LysR family regulator
MNAAVPCADLESVLLAEQTLHLVLPAGHSWQRAVGFAELAELRFVATPQGTATRGVLDDALRQVGLAPAMAVETTHRAMIVPLVLEGVGAALLPKSMAEDARVKGAEVATTAPELSYRARLVWRPGPLSPPPRGSWHWRAEIIVANGHHHRRRPLEHLNGPIEERSRPDP